ncbi:SUKH-3 domain-containing protein [Hymenobacter persicinus]|uniref:SUKH-3 domain containing protein n=1 Tax=Hymenobacter persicinus TaxID=2025506 RepID=A0A4Q5LES3_9BACT|nr:SUKH-3 domain-containing protein [Hymenobacter persicinus]RYU81011.1 hypothetical protein EWM57_07150 [Hymenobacter persicinus]
MNTLSGGTQSLLTNAGWYPGRTIFTIGYRFALWKDGYPWFSVVEEFLREFGSLRVTLPKHGQTDTFHFNVAEAVDDVDASWVQENYAERIGTNKLCVIGQAHNDYLLLFMSDAGKVYGGYDDYLCFIADSGVEAIEALCQNSPVQEIPERE